MIYPEIKTKSYSVFMKEIMVRVKVNPGKTQYETGVIKRSEKLRYATLSYKDESGKVIVECPDRPRRIMTLP